MGWSTETVEQPLQSHVTQRLELAAFSLVFMLGCGDKSERTHPVRLKDVPMILEISKPPGNLPREISKNPDQVLIEKTVRELAWSDITFVVLKIDDKNWIEGSGSLNPRDGLSARYMKDGKEHVSTRAPKSLDEIIALLQSYRCGDGRWQKLIDWD